MSQKILTTGAFGNVGCLVIDTLLSQGHEVVAFDKISTATQKNAKRYSNKPVTICWGDITDKQSIEPALKDVDGVIHLAAIFPPLSENCPQLTSLVNVEGTRNLIGLMQKSPTARRLVFASSIGVFGKQQWQFKPPLRASDTIAPDDYYGQSKVDGEVMIKSSSLKWSILRLGPCPPSSIKVMASFKDQNVFENHPDARMEVIHPADAALAFANAVSCDAAIGKTLLIGGGKKNQILYHEMMNTMFSTFGIGTLPKEIFRITDKVEFHGDWLDTEEGQTLLKYQRSDVKKLSEDFMHSFLFPKLVFAIFKLLSPVIKRIILRQSFYYQNRKGK